MEEQTIKNEEQPIKKGKRCICRPHGGIFCETTDDISKCFKCGWNTVVEKERKKKLYAAAGLKYEDPDAD